MNAERVSRDATLARLNGGVENWNKWRHEHANLAVDLKKSNLARRDLSAFNLQRTDLRGTNLREANLVQADLRLAALSGADLSGAALDRSQLVHADLRGAYLMYANAEGSDMFGANLNGANLTGANLQRANLNSTILLETVLVDCNLSGVEGIEFCDQPGPSIVDHRTYVRSGGLPLAFLRSCGLPEEVIKSYNKAVGPQLSCFLSYSTKDDTFAGKLYRSLQDAGIRCWFAPEHLDIGAKIRPSLDKEILSRDAFIVILSAKSIESPWVEKEVETAFERKYRGELTSILPIRLDDAVLSSTQAWAADLRRSIYIGDFSDWEGPAYQRALERLLRSLKTKPS